MTELTKGASRQLLFPGFKWKPNGLIANKGLTQEQHEHALDVLGVLEGGMPWAIGDAINARKEKWQQGSLEQLCDDHQLTYQSAANASSVCNEFEFSRRRENLKFSHHQEVQGRNDSEELLDWCEETDPPRSIKHLRQEKQRRDRAARLALNPPSGKYRVIYCDPPWEYTSGDQHTGETQKTVLGTHYPSMKLDEICELPISDLSHDDCIMFMWVTSPLLPEAHTVIESWGFEYKTSMVWDKVDHNVGNYVSVRHELLLICTRGQPPKVPKLVDSVYVEKRGKHSKKPSYFRDLIKELYPKGPRVELFSREQHAGWKVWGNEV